VGYLKHKLTITPQQILSLLYFTPGRKDEAKLSRSTDYLAIQANQTLKLARILQLSKATVGAADTALAIPS
jgi:hypothetical protein